MTITNVLVIDDEPFILDIFSQLLCDEGFNVQSVISNEDALTYLKKSDIDLILVDYHMKGMPFSEFIATVRGDDQYSDTPIIAVTGVPDRISKFDREQIQGIIEKPFLPEVFIKTIRGLVVC